MSLRIIEAFILLILVSKDTRAAFYPSWQNAQCFTINRLTQSAKRKRSEWRSSMWTKHKLCPKRLAITLTHMNRFWQFLAQVLPKKQAIKRYFIFPPHLTNASALPGETGNPEIACFYLNAACLLPKTHETKHIKNITWPQLKHPLLSKRSTVCTRKDLGREHIILQYVSRSMLSKSVTVSVAELFLSSIGVRIWDILLSQQMLNAIIARSHHLYQFCLSVRQCTGASCIQHSPTAAVQNSQLPFSWARPNNSPDSGA